VAEVVVEVVVVAEVVVEAEAVAVVDAEISEAGISWSIDFDFAYHILDKSGPVSVEFASIPRHRLSLVRIGPFIN
jgi:hypothetical protein